MRHKFNKKYEYFASVVKISFSLAAGILAAMLSDLQSGGGSACLAMCCLCIATPWGEGCRRDIMTCACCFLAGCFCRCCAGLSPSLAPPLHPGLLSRLEQSLESAIEALPFSREGTAPLLKALICGNRGGLDKTVTDSFRNAGAAHLLALSGLHLGIICIIVEKILAPLGNSRTAFTARAVIVTAVCGVYALMTGASPSVTRAFLFIAIREFAKLHPERRCSPSDVFCTALTIQLALNPLVLGSAGFQMSYLAMAGIFTLSPVLKSWFKAPGRANLLKRIWDAAATAISCQLFTSPVAWIRFHSFPVYFLLTNLIALPLVEVLVGLGIMALTMGAAGIDPAIPAAAADGIAAALEFCLNTICGM